jgi:hypothetical protein
MPSRIHSSRRLRIAVAEQVVSVIARQEQTEAQELQHFAEDDPAADAWAVAAQRMVRVVLRPLGQLGGELAPEWIGQP